MTDGPQQSPDVPEPGAGTSGIPPMPEGPVLRYTPGQPTPPTAADGRLAGGEQVWGSSTGTPPAASGSQQVGAVAPQFVSPAQPDNAVPQQFANPAQPGMPAPQQFGYPAQPGAVPPQQFGYPAQPGLAPGRPGAGVQQGAAPAVLALVCGVLGLVVPFLPIPLDLARPWIAFPLGVVGLGLGIAAVMGRRPMKAMAIVGIVFSSLAVVVGLIMIANWIR